MPDGETQALDCNHVPEPDHKVEAQILCLPHQSGVLVETSIDGAG